MIWFRIDLNLNFPSALKLPFIKFLSMCTLFLVPSASYPHNRGAWPSFLWLSGVEHWAEFCFIFQVQVLSHHLKSLLPDALYEWRLSLPWNLALPWPGSCSWACWPIVWKLHSPETSQWKTLSTSTLQVRLCSLCCRNVILLQIRCELKNGWEKAAFDAEETFGDLIGGCTCYRRCCMFYSHLFIVCLFFILK